MSSPIDPARAPTLAQIAARAGTSVPTVSKVLNGGTDVSDATCRRVMASAQELGYRRKTRTRVGDDRRLSVPLIDVVVKQVEGSWISGVLEGVEAAAAADGVDVVLSVARSDDDWMRRLLRRPSLGAIIVLVDTTAAQLNMLTTANIPVVVIDPISRPPADIASIGATNWDGGRLAAEHLLELGHTRIGVVGGRRAELSSSARIDGFVTALRAAGVTVPAKWLAYGDWDREQAHRVAAAMLSSSASRPSAIFACSDFMALGVYDAARDASLSIPGRVSIVGFDDIQESAWATPPMTTVRQPIVEMGAAAFRMLREADRTSTPGPPGGSAIRMELETRLITRLSTGRP
ncbi:LacI family DNA-binding transcriptional regulator [Agreia pratensis]|uniref:Transcriptional regulator, LacI family n=1 Tax=Agreia pratensis TaxID=150121 RepID=A0A1X7IH65_9MICO|nr:LacI family DNA-binding transcriptional regulator [Agreia pratensis]SMG14078.1 transcriptional regulator, LacI family [Agreia pratensis]